LVLTELGDPLRREDDVLSDQPSVPVRYSSLTYGSGDLPSRGIIKEFVDICRLNTINDETAQILGLTSVEFVGRIDMELHWFVYFQWITL